MLRFPVGHLWWKFWPRSRFYGTQIDDLTTQSLKVLKTRMVKIALEYEKLCRVHPKATCPEIEHIINYRDNMYYYGPYSEITKHPTAFLCKLRKLYGPVMDETETCIKSKLEASDSSRANVLKNAEYSPSTTVLNSSITQEILDLLVAWLSTIQTFIIDKTVSRESRPLPNPSPEFPESCKIMQASAWVVYLSPHLAS
ncbi:hypothetical protein WICPIJ_005516 [Wickerhamomyces pijperi]|uniref:Uncharacterized protein n=1 Tax=Wickerhamomyces pijperi TaxID=599730 RepID=A0A9P8Q5J4_WICPI|nr:hypothetical protein WICPIJ_005516 [Wickerhamomyces pijperi]